MTTHALKTWPEHYGPVERNEKRVELRYDDRGFSVGDILHLQEYEPMENAYTGHACFRRVTHILRGGPWLNPGYVVMSLEVIE